MFIVKKIGNAFRGQSSKKLSSPNEKSLIPLATTPSHAYDVNSIDDEEAEQEDEHKADEPISSHLPKCELDYMDPVPFDGREIPDYSQDKAGFPISSSYQRTVAINDIDAQEDSLLNKPKPAKIGSTMNDSTTDGQNSSFYTTVSFESTVNSRLSKATESSFPTETFQQWKERNMNTAELLKLDRLLVKQRERYGFNMFEALQPEDQHIISLLQNEQGFSFEEAVLYHFNAARGLKLPEPGKLIRKKSRQSISSTDLLKNDLPANSSPIVAGSNISVQNISPNSTQSSIATHASLPYMSPGVDIYSSVQEMSNEAVAASAFYHNAQEKYVENLEEEEQLRLSLMLSEQEEKCGWNMFDAMTLDDHIPFQKLLQQGKLFEEAMLDIYTRKFPSYMTPIHTMKPLAFNNRSVNPMSAYDMVELNNGNVKNIFRPPSVMYNTTPGMSPYLVTMLPSSHMSSQIVQQPQQEQQQRIMQNRRQSLNHPRHPSSSENRRYSSSSSSSTATLPVKEKQNGKKLHRNNSNQQQQHPYHQQNNSFNQNHQYIASGLYRPGSNPSMQLYSSHSSSSQNVFSPSGTAAHCFPTSQPPSRIPSRQSLYSRSTSSQLTSRSVSFSRSNSSTGNEVALGSSSGNKIPSLEPVRQDSPTRQQINRR